jgi:hypothetical protein
MPKAVVAFICGAALGALTIGLLARFAFGPPILLTIPIIAAVIALHHIGILLLQLWLGIQKAGAFGWITGVFATVIALSAFFPQPPRNPALLPTWLLTDLALRSLKPKLKAWLADRLGRPSNRD